MKTILMAIMIAATLVACRKENIDNMPAGYGEAETTSSSFGATRDSMEIIDDPTEPLDSNCTTTIGSSGSEKSLVTFQPSSLIRLCPTWINGDREFDGHGPRTRAYVSLFISGGNRVRARVYYKVRETVSDWSEAVYDHYITLYTAPPGMSIVSINSDTYIEVNYTDSNHNTAPVTLGSNQPAWRFIMNGDTQGNDIGNCTSDDAYLTVNFNPVQITLNLP